MIFAQHFYCCLILGLDCFRVQLKHFMGRLMLVFVFDVLCGLAFASRSFDCNNKHSEIGGTVIADGMEEYDLGLSAGHF